MTTLAKCYSLGAKSMAKLDGVHPSLVSVVLRSIQLTRQDFAVHDGLRTLAQQRALVAKGASKTLKSKHLPQPDGHGHAVDLVPYINGQLRWEWGPSYEIAEAVHTAATELNVPLRWGGVWDRRFTALPMTAAGIKSAVHAYCERHPGPDFIDGPHFEMRA